jgi:hypothetical protein
VPDAIGAAALEAVEHRDAPPEDMIRRECVKVSIIKAEMLHRIPKTAPVPREIVLSFHTRLQTFHDQLPSWMSLAQLIANEPSERMTQLRPVIFYVHLFYLSAMMLLSRRLVIAYVSLDANGEVFLPTEARRAIHDGFEAAKSNAQVMALMVSEGKVVQVCWLCMYVSVAPTIPSPLTFRAQLYLLYRWCNDCLWGSAKGGSRLAFFDRHGYAPQVHRRAVLLRTERCNGRKVSHFAQSPTRRTSKAACITERFIDGRCG